MVHDAPDALARPQRLDSVVVKFDEPRLVSDAGLLLTATLVDRLGIEELVNQTVRPGDVPGAAMPGRKVMTMLHGMLAGADSIDDMNVLRAGSTGLILGHGVMAPSTLGAFLTAFTFGHIRQLDQVPLVIDIDSFIGEVHSDRKQGAGYGYTRRLGYHPLLAVRADTGEVSTSATAQGQRTPSVAPIGSSTSCSPASTAPATEAGS
jgi:hypothetical protein